MEKFVRNIRSEERERCAKIADLFAEENMEMAGDSIILDPVLAGKGFTEKNMERSRGCQMDSTDTQLIKKIGRPMGPENRCNDYDESCSLVQDKTFCWLYAPEQGWCPFLKTDET